MCIRYKIRNGEMCIRYKIRNEMSGTSSDSFSNYNGKVKISYLRKSIQIWFLAGLRVHFVLHSFGIAPTQVDPFRLCWDAVESLTLQIWQEMAQLFLVGCFWLVQMDWLFWLVLAAIMAHRIWFFFGWLLLKLVRWKNWQSWIPLPKILLLTLSPLKWIFGIIWLIVKKRDIHGDKVFSFF